MPFNITTAGGGGGGGAVGNFLASDGTTTIASGDSVVFDHADGPGTTILTLIADGDGGTTDSDMLLNVRNSNDSFPDDLFSIGAEHVGGASYSWGFINFKGKHQGSGTELADVRLGLTSAAFNRIEFTGATAIDMNGYVIASDYRVGTGTVFTGYNEGQGGSATGTVRIYSGFAGGDVALGTASGPDDVWSLENHKFSSTLEQDVNDAGVGARLNQQGAGETLILQSNSIDIATFSENTTILGSGQLQTEATSGFPYIPSCSGVPTGDPITVEGMVPLVADSESDKLYIHSGGSWVILN